MTLSSKTTHKQDVLFDGGSKISSDGKLFESYDHVLPSGGSVGTVGENVTELRIGKLRNQTNKSLG